MATKTPGPEGSASNKTKYPTTAFSDPFDTVGELESSDDEWWDEESPPSVRPKVASKIQITQWPMPPTTTGVARRSTMRNSNHRLRKAYSVRKPTRDKSKGRQRKQNAKAGIKVVTNFVRFQGNPKPVQVEPAQKAGCFVDMATLQALDNDAPHAVGGWWTSKRPQQAAGSQNNQQEQISAPVLANPVKLPTGSRNQASNLTVSPLKITDDLSPSDRPIVIGISIPSTDFADRTLSPQTAASEVTKIVRSYEYRSPTQMPETPSITITPAEEVSAWSALSSATTSSHPGRRPTSSLYSQAAYNHYGMPRPAAAPPMPPVPAAIVENERQRMAAEKSCFSPDSDDGTIWEDDVDDKGYVISRPRTMASCTDFEDDESPIMVRGAYDSLSPSDDQSVKHLSVSTVATRHRSRGWWNYITTPFLTRSNTVAHREADNEHIPAIPSLSLAAAKVVEAERNEKLWASQFSPVTPDTATTISSEQWWVSTPKADQPENALEAYQKVDSDTRKHVAQPSSGTLPFILLADSGLGLNTLTNEANSEPSPEVYCSGDHSSKANDLEVLGTDRNTDLPRPHSEHVSGRSKMVDLHAPLPSIPPPVVIDPRQPTRSATFRVPPARPSVIATPPPPYSPPPGGFPRYRAFLPPGHQSTLRHPMSPGPESPGLAQTMSSRGAIPLSNVPLTPSLRRPINLNSGYPIASTLEVNIASTVGDLGRAVQKARKIEAKRQRHEREDAVARRAGGWWRGRGCIPRRGCYGRSGAEGRKRRRWYIGLVTGLLSLIILIIVLATALHRKASTITTPSQWLNLTGFPPIFEGVSIVSAPINVVSNTACVFPATGWSCDLPKELQTTTDPSRPNLVLNVQWDNSSSANATFANITREPQLKRRIAAGNPVSARQLVRELIARAQEIVTFVPSPAPPSFADEVFLGNTTDGIVSSEKAGEPTPFYVSFLSTTNKSSSTSRLAARGPVDNPFPDITEIIPAPSSNLDGTAAAANLLPFPTQQPIRLYDRGLPTEHYGFYTYFDRSIFLKSISPLNGSNAGDGAVPDDRNGGATKTEANYRCTWTQTRFLVQMWTRMGSSAQLINSTSTTQSHSATTFQQPVSFPYPITITTDRHGGDPTLKMLYCYKMDDRERIITSSGQINAENRGFGGTLINAAPNIFSNTSDPSLGGFDGGTGGCSCRWQNFQRLINT